MKSSAQVLAFAALALLAVQPLAFAQGASPVGRWDGVVSVSNNTIEIPFGFEVAAQGTTYRGYFFDGDVKVPSQPGTFENGLLDLRFDQYGARLQATLAGDRLEGKYDRGTRGAPYAFRAVRAAAPRVSGEKVPSISGEWRIPTKSSKGETAWRFLVRQNGAAVSATILRIDGDTGTLSGRFANGKFLISHFSGARPVKYEITQNADGSLQLVQNGQQTLTAFKLTDARAKEATPTSPTQFTRMKNPGEPFRFSYPDLDGRLVSNTDARFKGKVVLISITGSWCPNCHDEAPFLTELYRTYHGKGLEIVALGFEEADQLKNPVRPRAFVKQFGIEYPFLLVGEPEDAPARISQAENLNAFPTTFVLGKDGRVRTVHAGFASVATGTVHSESKKEMTAEIERLLAEKVPTTH
ncbi:MAG TPA: TlpA disulfide reductase family protein [Vicinamibacterales bacterium]|nr:TlpA disulfide reductase family protein [Vicinamibacterales bacterium]